VHSRPRRNSRVLSEPAARHVESNAAHGWTKEFAGSFRARAEGLIGKWWLAYASGVDEEAALFRALADRTRRLILDELAERPRQTLFELCARLATRHGLTSSRQAISQHLDVLEEAALVRSRREGRYRWFELDTGPLRAIAERWPAPEEEDR
jgi:DNA-binding transcriptional ArsR family regulator